MSTERSREPSERLVAPKDTLFYEDIFGKVHLFYSDDPDSKESNKPEGNVYYNSLCGDYEIGHSENSTVEDSDKVCEECLNISKIVPLLTVQTVLEWTE